MELEIVYQDENLVAINKPHGLLVHRSPIAADASVFALQILRDQIGRKVYPAHRIDRKTSGVLLFTTNKDLLPLIKKQFEERRTQKQYLAIVRGFTEKQETIDYALFNDSGVEQSAITHYEKLGESELPFPSGKFDTSRYSLILVKPVTGRMHQIRKHFAHIFHPIIGDRPHGCNKQNKIFLERFHMKTMLLHGYSLEFEHPISNQRITIKASLQSEFKRMISELQFEESFNSFFENQKSIT